MKSLKLYNYIRVNQKELSLKERFILIDEAKRCCDVIKTEIQQLVDGEADFSFAVSLNDNGQDLVLSVSYLVENFKMQPLQALIFLNWFTEEPNYAIDFLRRQDRIIKQSSHSNEEPTKEQNDILNSEI